jgi:hypothetical protein
VGRKEQFLPVLSQTYHHFQPPLIFSPFGCVYQANFAIIGLSIPWQSKVSSKYLVPKIHLILLQNIVGMVKFTEN